MGRRTQWSGPPWSAPFPANMAVDAANHDIYVANQGSSFVSVIITTTYSLRFTRDGTTQRT